MGIRAQGNPIASFADLWSQTGTDASGATPATTPGSSTSPVGHTATGGIISDYAENIEWGKIKAEIIKNKFVDQIVISKNAKTIKVTKNPDYFVTSPKNDGIVYGSDNFIDDKDFSEDIKKIIGKMGYKISMSRIKDTVLPIDETKFETLFYNPITNRLKKPDVIRKRIAGLTSYFSSVDPTLFPEIRSIRNIMVPMSEYQFEKYALLKSRLLKVVSVI